MGYSAEECFDEALIEAREKDYERNLLIERGESIPRLHGLPISVKDMVSR